MSLFIRHSKGFVFLPCTCWWIY